MSAVTSTVLPADVACGGAVEVGPAARVLRNGAPFPLVLLCTDQAAFTAAYPGGVRGWVERNQSALEALLFASGAILFRGFPMGEPAAAEQFSQFVQGFSGPKWTDLPYRCARRHGTMRGAVSRGGPCHANVCVCLCAVCLRVCMPFGAFLRACTVRNAPPCPHAESKTAWSSPVPLPQGLARVRGARGGVRPRVHDKRGPDGGHHVAQ